MAATEPNPTATTTTDPAQSAEGVNPEPAVEEWATPAARQRMLRDAELAKAMQKVIRKKIHPADRDDVQSMTLAAIWRAEHIPVDPERGTKYCCGIAKRVSKRWLEGERRRVDWQAESLDAWEEPRHADPAGDIAQKVAARVELARLEQRVDVSRRRALSWLAQVALGISLEEIAGEEDLPTGRSRPRCVARARS